MSKYHKSGFFVYFDPNSEPNFGLTQRNFALTQQNFAQTQQNFALTHQKFHPNSSFRKILVQFDALTHKNGQKNSNYPKFRLLNHVGRVSNAFFVLQLRLAKFVLVHAMFSLKQNQGLQKIIFKRARFRPENRHFWSLWTPWWWSK